jgi:hypothetical protein
VRHLFEGYASKDASEFGPRWTTSRPGPSGCPGPEALKAKVSL